MHYSISIRGSPFFDWPLSSPQMLYLIWAQNTGLNSMKEGGVSISNPKEIKAIDGFSRVADGDVVSRAANIQVAMTGNGNFPNSPVDLAALKTAIETFSALIAEALDGSKKVIAQKNKQRDMAIFQTSGFQAAAAKTATTPLTEKIRKIAHGSNSGEIDLWLKAVAGASMYEVRYTPAGAGAATAWTTVPLSNVKSVLALKGLTPATPYLIQARALVGSSFTDWSDPISFICT
jgi:hypothetical protein